MRRTTFVLSALLAMLASCSDPPVPASCGELPDPNACPASAGGSCSDPDCAAIYRCNDGAWTLVTRCDQADAGTSTTSLPDAGEPSCGDASAAVSATDPACTPLQAPECEASIAMSCPAAACTTTGCDTFLVCVPGTGWAAKVWGYCDEDSQLVVNQ